jgi:hypothetical protein
MNHVLSDEGVLSQQISSTGVSIEHPIGFLETSADGFFKSTSIISMANINKEDEAYRMYKYLKYTNSTVLKVIYDILEACRNQYKYDVVISRTGDNEILLYRNRNGEYRNIVIDEECDVFYFCIPVDRKQTYNEFHPYMQVDANALASKL